MQMRRAVFGVRVRYHLCLKQKLQIRNVVNIFKAKLKLNGKVSLLVLWFGVIYFGDVVRGSPIAVI